jgi:molybdopterin-guanine dinucleotide biosynthesis protein A
MRPDDVTALILAGGKATRLGGIDKRSIVVDGATIFERQVAALAGQVAEVLVSSRGPVAGYRCVVDQPAPPFGGAAARGQAPVVDDVADLGPLAGIAAGLAAATTAWLFVVAGDMPHVTREVVALILDSASDDCDAVGIRIGNRPQPLCTALRVATWRPIVAARIAARQLKVSALLTDEPVRVVWIDELTLRVVDPALRAMHNVNTPDDL